MADPANFSTHYDMDEVVDLSNDLLQFMEDETVPMGLGAASVALTLARLVSSRKLTYEEGQKFITGMVQFAANTFQEESVN